MRLFENQPQPAHLLRAIRLKVGLHGEQIAKEIAELREVFQRGLLDVRIFHLVRVIAETPALGKD